MSMGLDRKPQVRRTTPPSESVVASWYENASLLYSYSIDLSASEQSSMRELATRTLVNPPAWQKALIALRDAMVTPFGIKTSDTVRTSWDCHERVDFFPVHWEGKVEIVLGADDRLAVRAERPLDAASDSVRRADARGIDRRRCRAARI